MMFSVVARAVDIVPWEVTRWWLRCSWQENRINQLIGEKRRKDCLYSYIIITNQWLSVPDQIKN